MLQRSKITQHFALLEGNIAKYFLACYEFSLQEEEEFTVGEFWTPVQAEFKTISEKAIQILLQFSTSYLAELRFSTLTNTRQRMRVAISRTRPAIENIGKSLQAQVSH